MFDLDSGAQREIEDIMLTRRMLFDCSEWRSMQRTKSICTNLFCYTNKKTGGFGRTH
jgi:hypothetical protein